jgi:probable rRNA maturation factor
MVKVEVFGAGRRASGSAAEHGTGSSSGSAGGGAPDGSAAAATEARLPRESEIRRLCRLATAAAGVHDGHLAVEFVSAERIAELNARYRRRASATDVLAFPIDGAPAPRGQRPQQDGAAPAGARELGDVLICPEHASDIREAIVHGVLHLVGLDHETDNGEMLALQRRLLAQLGA